MLDRIFSEEEEEDEDEGEMAAVSKEEDEGKEELGEVVVKGTIGQSYQKSTAKVSDDLLKNVHPHLRRFSHRELKL